MTRKLTSMLLTVALIFGMLVFTVPNTSVSAEEASMSFTDVKSKHWFYEAVATVYEAGLMQGKSDTKFEPNSPMTRAELVTTLARIAGVDVTGKGSALTFSDTKKSAWYADYVGWAVENGLVNGYEDNTFKPNKAILRQEIASLLVRYFKYAGVSFNSEALIEKFTDYSKLPKWALADIEALRETGLIGGDSAGNFNPKNNATRAEVATIFRRYLETAGLDPMYTVIEQISSYKCKAHGMYHYICAKAEGESMPDDTGLYKMGAVIGTELGLDINKYEVSLVPSDMNAFVSLHDSIDLRNYGEKTLRAKIIIRNRATDATAESGTLFFVVSQDRTLDDDAFGTCYKETDDTVLQNVWDNLDDYYFFNKDGKVYIPANLINSYDLNKHFTATLLGLMDNQEYGTSGNTFHDAVLAEGDYDKLYALRGTGGECEVTLKIYNNYLEYETEPITFTAVVMTNDQSIAYLNGIIDDLDVYLRELSLLIDECDRLGYPTNYEDLAFSVIAKFAHELIPEYITTQDYARTAYLERSLKTMYEDAKASLEAYISGEKIPESVPKYVTSELEIDGFTIYAETVDEYGNAEKRPVYFFGYGDGTEISITELPYYEEYGSNTYHYYFVFFEDVVRRATEADTENVSADGRYVIDISGIEKDIATAVLAGNNNQTVTLMLMISQDTTPIHMIYPELEGVMYDYSTEGQAGPGVDFNPYHEKSLEIIEAYIRAVTEAFAKYDAVGSVVLTNEPSYKAIKFADYFRPMWVEFLKDRYNNDLDALNEAHRASYTDWSDAPILAREGLSKRTVVSYDNILFNSQLHSGFHKWAANIVREVDPDLPISIKLKTIEYDRAMQQYGMIYEDFDEAQDLAGCDDVREDVFYYDHIAYSEEAPVVDSEVHIYQDAHDWTFNDQMDKTVERILWRGFMHHLSIGNFWSWDYWPEVGINTGTFGNTVYRPYGIYNVGKVTYDANRLSEEISAIVNEEPEVALLYSYASRQFTYGDCTEAMFNLYNASLFNGMKVRIVTEQQIEKINKCKLLLIPVCENVTPETLEAIAEYQKNGGKVLIVGDHSLEKNEQDLPHNSDLIDEIKAASDIIYVQPNLESYRKILEAKFRELDLQNVWIIDAKTGEVVDSHAGIEWMYAEKDGKLYVTVYAMDITEPIDVKLMVDGKYVTNSLELRSGEEYGETFTLYLDECVLLAVGEEAVKNGTVAKSTVATENGFEYAIVNGEAKIVRYVGNSTNVTIPSTLGGKKVTSVGGFAFTESSVESVTFASTVTVLEDYAFYDCDTLVSVKLSDIKAVSKRAFYDCDALKSIILPDSVTSIGNYAFAECDSLETVEFSDNITAIDDYAFLNCKSLSSLDLPDSLVYIGVASFKYCSSIDGVVEIPWGVTDIPYWAFAYCGSVDEFVIPNSVRYLGEKSLYHCSSVKRMVLPNSIVSVEGHALTETATEYLEFGYGLVKLGSVRFEGEVYIPATLNSFGEYVTIVGEGKMLVEAGSYAEEFSIRDNKPYEVVHKEQHIHTPGAAPTCDAHQTCTDCGAVISVSHGHSYSAAADSNGMSVYVCTTCGDVKKNH